ncbi:MAG: plastocyanin/azurin family copper-binding protein [Catenulispora sp.]
MTEESLESGPPNPASGPKTGVGRKALIAIAALSAVCSAALLVSANGTAAAPRAVSQSAVTLDVTQAAAYAATSANTVEIKSYAYSPAALTVPVGTTVTWVNEDSVPHTVTGTSGPAKFDSGQLASGASWSGTFMTPGTYKYYCADHPQMVAQITVTGDSTPPPSSTSATAPPSSKPSTTPPSTPSSTHTTPPASSSGSVPSSSSMSMPGGSSSSPAPSKSSSMSMPPPSGSGGQCGAPQALSTLIQHIDSAHLGESPGQQVQDLTNLNQYVLSHTTLVANILTPLLNQTTNAATSTLSMLIQHIDTAHLGESPGQQVSDLLNLDQYVLSHTTLIGNLLTPEEGLLTGSC